MVTPAEFVEAARTYLGVRWHHLGRSRLGVDCVGLLLCAADDCGIPHDEPAVYPRGHRGYDLIRACHLIGKEIPIADLQDGDILLFSDSIFPCHMGIRSTRNDSAYVIHAHAFRHKVVEEPLQADLYKGLRKAFRPRVFEAEASTGGAL